ncbi:DedA family protein [Dactylosporangium sp. AC04546]|uniref:DedA family protein n=1 Tax=Dactylosporangium sp. AC04546 TaxID=2862460 RepID=UPI001EE018BF|nr:DedA family protein [Dactylosporangium sp. AC04546]WVK82368.1 DedA family protein [Dactylosporangium sp. AC04546]
MHHIEEWMSTLPAIWIYLLVGGVIGIESMGIPVPGEITLVTASLLSVTTSISPWLVASAASAGAIIGDSLGYYIGRRGGRRLLERFGRRFPKHFGPEHLAKAERAFQRWGVWAVFFGRFIALLRILAGPLAGALHVPYGKFLAANALGGLTWAFGTVFAIYSVGRVAEKWLKDFSWIALAAAVVAGLATTVYLRRKAAAEARATAIEAEKEPAATP